ncbi:hypothetical protein GCM10020216_091000 [Nonomuraea helvata]
MAAANNGKAAIRIPSPKLDSAVASHNRRYAGPNDAETIGSLSPQSDHLCAGNLRQA